jgi:transcriptional regulator with PAS, ATPase and Fis domain
MLDIKFDLDIGKIIEALNNIVKQWSDNGKIKTDAKIKSAVPSIVKYFLSLADQNEQFAEFLEQSFTEDKAANLGKAQRNVDNIKKIISTIKSTIAIIDPNWVAANVELFQAVDKLYLEKAAFADNILQIFGPNSDMDQLTQEQMEKIGASLREEADKLTKVSKRLSSLDLLAA